MRTITISIDDAGGIKVKILGDEKNHRFLTKREFDRSLRATRVEYRRSIKEYRRKQLLKRLGEENHGIKRERSEENREGCNEYRPSQSTEPKASANTERDVSGSSEPSLERAIEAKARRNKDRVAGKPS